MAPSGVELVIGIEGTINHDPPVVTVLHPHTISSNPIGISGMTTSTAAGHRPAPKSTGYGTAHHEHGFYGGVPDQDISPDSPILGVNRWAESTIVGRAVLIDVEGFRAVQGKPIDHERGEHLTVELLVATLRWQRTALRGSPALR